MSRNDHVPHSLRGEAGSTALPDPYPAPDPADNVWPEGWTSTARENWRTYAGPVHDALDDNEARWYRRIYRPKHTGEGLLQTDDVTVGNECDYVAETIQSTVNDREFRLKQQRQVARIRSDDPLDEIAGSIIAQIREVARDTGIDPTKYIPDDQR
jgi:hypothetical protein